MKSFIKSLFVLLALTFSTLSFAATWYVSPAGDDSNNGSSLEKAKESIQAAVDISSEGDTILVSDGTYELTDKIEITKPITIKSINGADVTTITAALSPPLNPCFYINHNNYDESVIIDGFTITKGSRSGVYVENGKTTVIDSIITENSSGHGGGITGCTVLRSEILNNTAGYDGGGALNCTLYNCLIKNNEARNGSGGGLYGSTAYNCVIVYNSADLSGGGADDAYLNNCLIAGNTITGNAGGYGGGISYSTIRNCTVVGNYGK
ncbi:MAG: hypothetical protein GX811_05190, partial [Lentisphaerae bacterium]|nr:hypothetical protein [Lentisphaerota bacterium]